MLKVFLFNRARKVCRINSSGEIICQNGAKYLKCEGSQESGAVCFLEVLKLEETRQQR